MSETGTVSFPEIDPNDELSWCDHTAAFLEWQGGQDIPTAEQLRAFHAQQPTPPGVEYRPEVVYGTAGAGGRDLTMLLYAREDPSERRPAVVMMHGGGWRRGTALSHRRQAWAYAGRGMVAASINYRFSDEALFPAALEDAKAAVRWIKAHHAEIGADPERVIVAGGSAGAHLAAMIATTPGMFEGSGGNHDEASDVAAAVLYSPMTDMHAPGGEIAKPPILAFLGSDDEDLIVRASPITYVRPGLPPILSMVGSDDPATPLPMIQAFHDALDRAGVVNELVVYPGRRHAFGLHGDDWHDVVARTSAFIEGHLGS